jgi:hypothetical protein
MVDVESQLHRLLDQAAPVPPRAVTPDDARRRARKQRQRAATVTAVVCSLAVAVAVPYLATRDPGRSTQLTTRPSPPPAGSLDDEPAVRAAGIVLGLNGMGQLVRAWPGTDRQPVPLSVQAIPGGPSLITTDPTGGWVVTFTPESHPQYGDATQRLAFVSTDGTVEPFGPTFAGSDAITGLAFSPDGGSVAIAVFHTSTAKPAEIWVFSGAEHQARTWVADKPGVNEIISLSWNQAGTQLAYIAGFQTGAGIAANPSFLDVTRPGRSAPTDSPWRQRKCAPDAASWLQHDRFAVISNCGRDGSVLQTVNPHSGEPIGSPQTVGGFGCLGGWLHPADNTDDVLVSACDALYVLHDGTLSKLHDDLRDAAWPGHNFPPL